MTLNSYRIDFDQHINIKTNILNVIGNLKKKMRICKPNTNDLELNQHQVPLLKNNITITKTEIMPLIKYESLFSIKIFISFIFFLFYLFILKDMMAEARLLRQHKGRLEARMQILEDHNRQLEAQLQRLRQLLDEVNVRINLSLTFKTYDFELHII